MHTAGRCRQQYVGCPRTLHSAPGRSAWHAKLNVRTPPKSFHHLACPSVCRAHRSVHRSPCARACSGQAVRFVWSGADLADLFRETKLLLVWRSISQTNTAAVVYIPSRGLAPRSGAEKLRNKVEHACLACCSDRCMVACVQCMHVSCVRGAC